MPPRPELKVYGYRIVVNPDKTCSILGSDGYELEKGIRDYREAIDRCRELHYEALSAGGSLLT